MKISTEPDEHLTAVLEANGIDWRRATDFRIEHEVGRPVYVTVTLIACEKREGDTDA